MFYRLRVWILAVGLLAAGTAVAGEQDPWSGKVAFGYLGVSGNTETETINFSTEINYDLQRWHHTLLATAFGSSSEDDDTGENETTSEAYKASYKVKYDLTERTYVFGFLDYNKDRFSGYDKQTYESIGLGRRILNTERHKLSGEIGAGARQSDLRDGMNADEAIGFTSVEYDWKISENADFMQKISVFSGSDNTYVESISELKAGIIGDLALALSYTVKRNSDVPAGSDKTDTYTAISLEYAF